MRLEEVPIERLTISPFNARRDVGDLTELKESIKAQGLLQPIMVRPVRERLEVVVGQRRFLACKELGWKSIPAVIREMADTEALELSLSENVQIRSLDLIECGEAIERLLELYREAGFAETEALPRIARRVAKSVTTLRSWIDVSHTAKSVKEAVRRGKMAVGVAAWLRGLPEVVQTAASEVIQKRAMPKPLARKLIGELKRKRETIEKKAEPKLEKAVEEVAKQVEMEAEVAVNVSMPFSLLEELRERADELKVTIPEFIRRAIRLILVMLRTPKLLELPGIRKILKKVGLA